MRCIVLYFLLAFAASLPAQNKKFVLVIDAGHGGHDIGAPGKIMNEKNINLAVALKFGAAVEQNFDDVSVIYTRRTDRFIALRERADAANSNHADLFVSIHTNANKSAVPFGAETYTLGLHKTKSNLDVAIRENSVIMLENDYKQTYHGFDPNSVDSYIMFELMQDKYLDRSVEFASNIQKQFVDFAGRYDRGVRQAGFLVLHRSACPSVLIELGFISNRTEEKFLANSAGQQKMATSIYNAFVQYKKEYDKRTGKITLKPETATAKSAQSSNEPLAEEDNNAINAKPVFKIQIIASGKKLNLNAEYFIEKGLYKYTIGAETDYAKIKELQKTVRRKYPDCFVIAFSGNKKLTEKEALEMIGF